MITLSMWLLYLSDGKLRRKISSNILMGKTIFSLCSLSTTVNSNNVTRQLILNYDNAFTCFHEQFR